MLPHEQAFERLGLLGSPWSPAVRALLVFSATSVVIFLAEPELFYKDGKLRPWDRLVNVDGLSTPVPWWFVPLLGATAAALV